MNINILNQKYKAIDTFKRVEAIFNDFPSNEILVTSSFGTTSAILLQMISKVKPNHPIYTINTGYLFPETLKYMEILKRELNLKIKIISASKKKHQITVDNKTYLDNQDLCCQINKLEPLDLIKKNYKYWMSGLMAYQSNNRREKALFEKKNNIIKCYPILDLSQNLMNTFKIINNLPPHPLAIKGYDSIGCTHCTAIGTERKGRWESLNKTECGLHL